MKLATWCLALLMALTFANTGAAQSKKAAPTSNPPSGQTATKTATTAPLIDLNAAPADVLKSLPGIGDAYSAAIIKNRPYANKTQLVSRKVIPQATYDKIADKVIAKQPAKK